MRSVYLTSCLAIVAGSACLGTPAPSGPRLDVDIAALTLVGPDNVCYDLLVENATGTVWSMGDPLLTLLGADQSGGTTPGAPDTTTVCSTQYGNSAGGDVTYIGTCDATSDSDPVRDGVQNRVTLWVDGIYKSGADVGDWQDPCESGCSLSIDCNENEDARVEFNLTLMRQANQGFFDIAVNFEDIFCSAKFDTCYPDGDDADLLDDNITLLHGAGDARDWTGIFGFACSAGSDATQTNLLYGPIAVTCGTNVFALDPNVVEGNASATGSAGGTLHYGVYRGNEQLDCGGGVGSCKKVFWNLALSIEDLEALGGSCSLALTATANDANKGFALGRPTATGVSYPYIDVATTLTNNGAGICQRHALNATSSAVQTHYRGNLGGAVPPTTMCNQFNGSAVSTTGGCDASTCGDGIQNQGETGVDCGGPCGACSVLPVGPVLVDYFPSETSETPIDLIAIGTVVPSGTTGLTCDLSGLAAYPTFLVQTGPCSLVSLVDYDFIVGAQDTRTFDVPVTMSDAFGHSTSIILHVAAGDVNRPVLFSPGSFDVTTASGSFDLATAVSDADGNQYISCWLDSGMPGVSMSGKVVTWTQLTGFAGEGFGFGVTCTDPHGYSPGFYFSGQFPLVGQAPTCADGVQNQGETAVDCGGSSCPACANCSDNIQNGGETGVDCGGPCPLCSMCSDGIQNGYEDGIDCGAAGEFQTLVSLFGGVMSRGYAINDAGLIAGEWDGRAVLADPAAWSYIDLATRFGADYSAGALTSIAYALNNDGQTVGVVDPPPAGTRRIGFEYDLDNDSTALPALIASEYGNSLFLLNGINDAGVMVGLLAPWAAQDAFVFDPDTNTLVDIGLVAYEPGYSPWWTSFARAVNDAGVVVGSFEGGGHQIDIAQHAFIYDTSAGTVTNLDAILVAQFDPAEPDPEHYYDGYDTEATDINDAGIIVGVYSSDDTTGGGTSDFMFTYDINTGVATKLPPIGVGCRPEGINEAGTVIGFCNQGGAFAYFPTTGVVRWLSGAYPLDINTAGQITGQRNGHAFVWRPLELSSGCLPCTASCTDFVQNGAETGVDCGGPCQACPSCSDGLRNQNELIIDCGGVCPCANDCMYIQVGNANGAHWSMPADAPACDLFQANLGQFNLNGANLAGANLSRASLKGTQLFGADLTDANLSFASALDNGCDLRNANLTNANLTNAVLDECAFGNNIWLGATCRDGVVVDGTIVTSCMGHL